MEIEHIDKVISSYQHLGRQAYDLVYSTTPTDIHQLLRYVILEMPIVPFLITFHVTYASLATYRVSQGRDYWLKSLVLTTFASFGGSTLAAILSGQPTPLFTTSSNPMLIYIITAWYIIHHNALIRNILSIRPIHAIIAFGATIAKARSIIAFMDDFMYKFDHNTAMGAIALGGLSGCGGSLFVSADNGIRTSFKQPSELSRPGWGVKGSYTAAIVYYLLTDPHSILTQGFGIGIKTGTSIHKDEARFWIALLLAIHAAMEILLGTSINPFSVFDRIAVTITRVNTDSGEVEEEEDGEKEGAKKAVEELETVSVKQVAGKRQTRTDKVRKRRNVTKVSQQM